MTGPSISNPDVTLQVFRTLPHVTFHLDPLEESLTETSMIHYEAARRNVVSHLRIVPPSEPLIRRRWSRILPPLR